MKGSHFYRILSDLDSIGGVTESISELDIELDISPSNISLPPSTDLSGTELSRCLPVILTPTYQPITSTIASHRDPTMGVWYVKKTPIGKPSMTA